jgi:hypothetical protein
LGAGKRDQPLEAFSGFGFIAGTFFISGKAVFGKLMPKISLRKIGEKSGRALAPDQ